MVNKGSCVKTFGIILIGIIVALGLYRCNKKEKPKERLEETGLRPGFETALERKYQVDLRGKFNHKEISYIEDAIYLIRRKVDLFNKLDIVIEKDSNLQSAAAIALSDYIDSTDANKEKDFVLIKDFEKPTSMDSAMFVEPSYVGILVHEIGHLLWREYVLEGDKLRERLFGKKKLLGDELIEKYQSTNSKIKMKFEGNRPIGYVSAYCNFEARDTIEIRLKERIYSKFKEAEQFINRVKERMKIMVEFYDSTEHINSKIDDINYYKEKLSALKVPELSKAFRIKEKHLTSLVTESQVRLNKAKSDADIQDALELTLENLSLIKLLAKELIDTANIIIDNFERLKTEFGPSSLVSIFHEEPDKRPPHQIDKTNEEIAEVFTYWILDKNYANHDHLVRQKIKIFEDFIKETYPKDSSF